jgi:hypothetical protein
MRVVKTNKKKSVIIERMLRSNEWYNIAVRIPHSKNLDVGGCVVS